MTDEDSSDMDNADPNADIDKQSVTRDQESTAESARLLARRRILVGGLATAPLILTLASRPALATGGGHWGGGKKCGVSGLISGNLSNGHQDTNWCHGKDPCFWKQKDDGCRKHFVIGPCNPIYQDYWGCKDFSVPRKYDLEKYRNKLAQNYWHNRDKIRKCDDYLTWLRRYPNLDSPPFGTPFSEVFGHGIASDSKLTVMQALWLDDQSPHPPSGNAGPAPLIAHCAAAYCNASEYGKDGFGLSPRDVVDKVNNDIYSRPYRLEEELRLLNSQG